MPLLHAPAKLNLFLEVTGKREDGYHTLSTLSAFTEFGDIIHLEESHTDSLKITGEFAAGTSIENNLALKALDACKSELGVTQNYSLVLEKNIPVGAGLGGGSADAAAIIRYFTGDEKTAAPICRKLGADVFMCWLSRPALLGGIGDELVRLEDVPPYHVVLVNPKESLSTEEVFGKLSSHMSFPRRRESSIDLDTGFRRYDESTNILREILNKKNHLTQTAISILPKISDILALLEKQKGLELARMSGSGATCFALFTGEAAAIQCENNVKESFPDYWVRRTQIKKAA